MSGVTRLVVDRPQSIGGYSILAIAGDGGMGIVYRAVEPSEDRMVALKVLRPGILAPEWFARFRREVEVLQRFDHPNIARFFKAGFFDTAIGPQPYYAMEFVEGLKLGEWAAQANPTETQRLELLADLCDALHYTHEQGVIHRDLKPSNILVTPDGRPKLIDFGIAAREPVQTSATTFATGTQVMLGTVPYMSPEQAQTAPGGVDARSDIYSLGVMAYELLTGQLPYDSASPSIGRALHAILNTEPIPLGRVAQALKGNVETIVHRALEKNPADRYPTAAAMAKDLRRHLSGKRIPISAADRRRRFSRSLRARPRLRAALLAGTSLLVVGGIVIATIVLRARNDAGTQRTAWNRFYTLVEDGDRCRHYGAATLEKWRECITIYHRALADLDRLPPRPFTGDLERYIAFRLGELHYFLGERAHDADLLDQARAQWDRWEAIPWRPGSAAGIDSSFALRKSVLGMGKDAAQGGIALSVSKLATYRDRVSNLRSAIAQQENVRRCLTSEDCFHPGQLTAARRELAIGFTYLNRGANLARLGAATDSVAVIDRGIAELQRAKGILAKSTEPGEGMFYLQLALGEGHVARAELTGGGLAAAFACFDSIRDVNMSGQFRSTWRWRCAQANAWIVAARQASDASAKRRARANALDALSGSMQGLNSQEDDFEIAVSRSLAAGVYAELNVRNDQARADSLFQLAATVLTPQRFPLQCAEMELLRAKAARIQFGVEREPHRLDAARDALQRAGNLVPPAQYPRLHRLVREEEARLAAAAALTGR